MYIQKFEDYQLDTGQSILLVTSTVTTLVTILKTGESLHSLWNSVAHWMVLNSSLHSAIALWIWNEIRYSNYWIIKNNQKIIVMMKDKQLRSHQSRQTWEVFQHEKLLTGIWFMMTFYRTKAETKWFQNNHFMKIAIYGYILLIEESC